MGHHVPEDDLLGVFETRTDASVVGRIENPRYKQADMVARYAVSPRMISWAFSKLAPVGRIENPRYKQAVARIRRFPS